MEYQEFLNKLQKRGSKPHIITHCLGVRDAWKWVRKNKWKSLKGKSCSHTLYGSIVNEVNKILMEQLLEGHEIELPHKMGSIYLASTPAKIACEGDEIKTNYRTDWLKTLKLWYEDAEACESHKTVKRIQKDILFIKYDKSRANYTNKRFYVFRANRSLVKKVGHAAESRKLSSVNLNKL